MKKKLISFLLILSLMIAIVPFDVCAAEQSGTFGDNLIWELDSLGTLTISGQGSMKMDTTQTRDVPWKDYLGSINKVVINNGVTDIGAYAFDFAENLTSVKIPNSVININYNAFSYCKKLENIEIPNSVKTIGNNAFRGTSISSIDIPASVTSIGSEVFYGTLLSEIIVAETNRVYSSNEGALYNKDKTELLFCPNKSTGDFTVPNGTKIIANSAFSIYKNLSKLYLPATVEVIGNYNFNSLTHTKFYWLFFEGTEEQWNTISIGALYNDKLNSVSMEFIEPEYISGLSCGTIEPTLGEEIEVNISVNHNSDTCFNAAEIEITYDNSALDFLKDESTIGDANVKASNGTIVLADYGKDKNFGASVYVLNFKTIKIGETSLEMIDASFVDKEGAVESDLIDATINSATVSLTVKDKTFEVELPTDESIEGSSAIIEGNDYIFSTTNMNYSYVFKATIDGVEVPVVDNGDGTYTIKNVTGKLCVQLESKTPKNYFVTFKGTAKDDFVSASSDATYMSDYSFNMPSKKGWTYTLQNILIEGKEYIGYSVNDLVYTIPGNAVTGNVEITVNKEQVSTDVQIEGTGAGLVTGNPSVEMKNDYTFSVQLEEGYVYEVKAYINGAEVSVIKNEDGTYTVKNINGDLKIVVNKFVDTEGSTVDSYITLNGTKMWLVKVPLSVADGKVPTYDGNKMVWSEKYKAFCYLLIADTLPEIDVNEKVDIVEGERSSVNYSGDVNCTGVVDASDAQLAYDVYKAKYSDFNIVSMEKFLRADANGDEIVDMTDAQAIISEILK